MQKPIYKQWWAWLIAIILLIGIISMFTNKDKSTKTTDNSTKSSLSSSNTSKKSPKDLISINKNMIKTPKGSIEVIKEAIGKTTDGKDGVILMYKITNNSNEELTPKQILSGNQISVYEKNAKSDKPAEEFFGATDFQDLSDYSNDSAMNISDAISNDNNNWDKTKIQPHQSITMSDGKLWKMDNSNDSEIKVTDSINDIDENVINKGKNSYKISSPVEKIDITKWNG